MRQALFYIFMSIVIIWFAIYLLPSYYSIIMGEENKTAEEIALEEEIRRNQTNAWLRADEIKFCNSNAMIYNDSYNIGGCQVVECKNETGLATYQFCEDNDNLGMGILIGWLLFSGR